jgi:hypothetical protein
MDTQDADIASKTILDNVEPLRQALTAARSGFTVPLPPGITLSADQIAAIQASSKASYEAAVAAIQAAAASFPASSVYFGS